jgi:regulator of replication initiation timing
MILPAMVVAATGPDTWEVIGIVAGVVSIVLAAFAIWQASVFFRWSNTAQREAEQAAKGIDASVKKLEDVFNRLYSDTFGIMRDTVSDMREHMWPAGSVGDDKARDIGLEEIDKRTAENIEELRKEVHEQVGQVVSRVGATNEQVTALEGQLGTVVDQALEASRQAQAEAVRQTLTEAVRGEIALAKRQRKRSIEADELVAALRDRFDFEEILSALGELRDQGILHFEGSLYDLGPATVITFPPSRRTRRIMSSLSSSEEAGESESANGSPDPVGE